MQNNNTNSLSGSHELRKRLPYGTIRKLAEKHECSVQWIHRVITGRVTPEDTSIIEDAYRLAELGDLQRKQLESVL